MNQPLDNNHRSQPEKSTKVVTVRMSEDLHTWLTNHTKNRDVSMNQFILNVIQDERDDILGRTRDARGCPSCNVPGDPEWIANGQPTPSVTMDRVTELIDTDPCRWNEEQVIDAHRLVKQIRDAERINRNALHGQHHRIIDNGSPCPPMHPDQLARMRMKDGDTRPLKDGKRVEFDGVQWEERDPYTNMDGSHFHEVKPDPEDRMDDSHVQDVEPDAPPHWSDTSEDVEPDWSMNGDDMLTTERALETFDEDTGEQVDDGIRRCPYKHHASDCDCDGMGGDR